MEFSVCQSQVALPDFAQILERLTVTKLISFPLLRMDDCIDRLGPAVYVSNIDLLKGYWQIPLTEHAKEISALVILDGLLQYTVIPFGMRNAPATFQHMVNQILAGISNCVAYPDDLVVFSVKALLTTAPVLAAPNFAVPFVLTVDASDLGAGAVLIQHGNDGLEHPVYFFLRKFNCHQRAYSTIEKEPLALALQHFEVYVGVVNPSGPDNRHLMRWCLQDSTLT